MYGESRSTNIQPSQPSSARRRLTQRAFKLGLTSSHGKEFLATAACQLRPSWTRLHFAASKDYLAVAEFLVDEMGLLDEKADLGMTALQIAALNGHASIIKLLISKGADVASTDCYGKTTVELAQVGFTSLDSLYPVAQALFRADREGHLRPQRWDMICSAVRQAASSPYSGPNYPEIGGLIMAGSLVGAFYFILDPLCAAVEYGDANIVRFLLGWGIVPCMVGMAKWDNSPLRLAVKKKDVEITKLLLETGKLAHVDLFTVEGILRVLKSPDRTRESMLADLYISQLEELGQINAKVSNGGSLLHFAAACGDDDLLSQLVTKGLSVNARDDDGMTPLHRAVLTQRELRWVQERVERVDFLVSHGADLTARDACLRTPLLLAAQHGFDTMAEKVFTTSELSEARVEGKSALEWALEHEMKRLAGKISESGVFLPFKTLKKCHNGRDSPKFRATWAIFSKATCDGSNELPLEDIGWWLTVGGMTPHTVVAGRSLIGWTPKIDAHSLHGEAALRSIIKHLCVYDFGSRDLSSDEGEETILEYSIGQWPLHLIEYLATRATHRYRATNVGTPLHKAAEKDLYDEAELLIKLECGIHARNTAKQTALHVAARLQDSKLVKMCLDGGMDPNARDDAGQYPNSACFVVQSLLHAARKQQSVQEEEDHQRYLQFNEKWGDLWDSKSHTTLPKEKTTRIGRMDELGHACGD